MSTIIILGHGKLAKDLTDYFGPKGYEVLATKTQANTHDVCSAKIFTWSLGTKLPNEILQKQDSCKAIIISLPPLSTPGQLEKGLIQLFEQHPELKDKLIFYTNSISLYGENQGDVDEQTAPLPQKARGAELLQLENNLLKNCSRLYSLRLGGLFSKERHPVFYLAGRKNLSGKKAYLNGVDHRDVARAIDFVIEENILERRINIVWDQHPLKSTFYKAAAREKGLPLPEYSDEEINAAKRVHSRVLKEKGFSFKYPLTNDLT